MRKKLHPKKFIDACWTFTETKQWMLAQWGGGCRVSAVATATWKTSHDPDVHAQLSHHEMKSVSISMKPGQTINSDRYIATVTKLKARISRVRPEKKTFLLQHDNARPHASLKTMEHIVKLGWTVLPHPSYSPDLAPSDFHLFRSMKDGLCGQHFPSNNVVIAAVKQWTTSAGADFYERSMQALVHRWRKCIADGGDYVEK